LFHRNTKGKVARRKTNPTSELKRANRLRRLTCPMLRTTRMWTNQLGTREGAATVIGNRPVGRIDNSRAHDGGSPGGV
jgi:hypothetical protein